MQFEATITSKGQVTLPARLRERLNLKDGDKVEFYVDHEGRTMIRPRVRTTEEFLAALEPRQPDPTLASDDDAIAILDGRDDTTRPPCNAAP